MTLVMSGCFAATVQVAVARGRIGIAAGITNFAVIAFALITFPAVYRLGLVAFPLVELGLNVVGFAGLLWLLHHADFNASARKHGGQFRTTPASIE